MYHVFLVAFVMSWDWANFINTKIFCSYRELYLFSNLLLHKLYLLWKKDQNANKHQHQKSKFMALPISQYGQQSTTSRHLGAASRSAPPATAHRRPLSHRSANQPSSPTPVCGATRQPSARSRSFSLGSIPRDQSNAKIEARYSFFLNLLYLDIVRIYIKKYKSMEILITSNS